MAKQTINVGTAPNDGTGDQLRDALVKVNGNFNELYGHIITTAPVIPAGVTGNIAGMVAFGDDTGVTYFYVCVLDYVDATTPIWKRMILPDPTSGVAW